MGGVSEVGGGGNWVCSKGPSEICGLERRGGESLYLLQKYFELMKQIAEMCRTSLANDHWELAVTYTFLGQIDSASSYITFLPDGSIDATRISQADLTTANYLLAPTISYLKYSTNVTFDFWRFIN